MNQFSLDYPEYHIAGILQNDFKKSDNFSVSVPLSRQQKHYDLLLYNGAKKSALAIQVKSSRTYVNTNPKKVNDYNYRAWVNAFQTNQLCDYYFIYIPFPLFDMKNFRPKAGQGLHLLVFNYVEMTQIINNRKLTRTGNPDKFFYIDFHIGSPEIYGTRGFEISGINLTNNLYLNKLDEIKKSI